MEVAFLCAAAFLAGFVDSIAGGGGLIQLPAVILIGGGLSPATLLATNKFSSICGTTAAIFRYSRSMKIKWGLMVAAALLAGLFSNVGSRVVPLISVDVFRPVAMLLLAFVLVFTLVRKKFGKKTGPKHGGAVWALFFSALIGFYDGFFGPGTGGFLIFVLVYFLGWSFLEASANAKIINWAANFASLIFFIPMGFVKWEWALPMAAFNVVGGILGSHTAIKKGDSFVRPIFVLMVLAALVRLIWF